MTTLINKGLIPVIDFLSSSKFAMTGALVLFASSITKMLLPALGDMSAANRAAAAIAAESALRAATSMEKRYQGAIRSVKAAFKTVPPSVKAVEAQFVSGGLSVQQYRTHLLNLKKSEKLRAVALQRYSGQQLSQRQRELAEVRALIAETQKLMAIESQRGGAGAGVQAARQSSRMSKRQSIYQDKIAKSSLLGGFMIAGRGAKENAKEITKATGSLNKLKVAFSAAGKGASLFGSALLRMLPVVGWLMTGFSLLSPLFGDLFKKSKLSKATDEVVESFESFARIAAQLNIELDKTDDIFEKTNKMLSVRVGILQQISAGVSKVIDQQEADETEKTQKALEKLTAAQKKAERVNSNLNYSIGYRNRVRKQVTKAEQEYQDQLKKSSTLSTEAAKNILRQAQSYIKAAGLAKVFGNELESLQELQDGITEPQDATAFLKSVEDITKPARQLKASQDEANEATIKLEQAVKSFTEKAKGQFGELFTNTSALVNALADIKEQAENTETQGIELVTKEQIAQITRLGKALNVAVDPKDYIKSLTTIQNKIAKNNVLASTSEKKAKALTKEAKELNKLKDIDGDLRALQLDLDEQILDVRLQGLNATLQNVLAEEGIASQSDRVLKLKEDIKSLEGERLSTAERILEIELAQATNAEVLIKREIELLKATKDRALQENDIARARAKMAAAAAGQSGISAQTDIALLNEQLKILQKNNTAAVESSGAEATYKKLIEQFKKERDDKLEQFNKVSNEQPKTTTQASFSEKTTYQPPGTDSVETRIVKLTHTVQDGQTLSEIAWAYSTTVEALQELNNIKNPDFLNVGTVLTVVKEVNDEAERRKKTEEEWQRLTMGDNASKSSNKTPPSYIAPSNRDETLEEIVVEGKRKPRPHPIKGSGHKITPTTIDNTQRKIANIHKTYDKQVEDAKKQKANAVLKIEQDTALAIIEVQTKIYEAENRLQQEAFERTKKHVNGMAQLGMEAAHVRATALAKRDHLLSTIDDNDNLSDAGKDMARDAAKGDYIRTVGANANNVMSEIGASMEAFPGGEFFSQKLSGIGDATQGAANAFTAFTDSSLSGIDALNTGLSGIGSLIQGVSAITQAAAAQKIEAIDREIDAEKKRDGQSAESVEKIKNMEKKKEATARKAFEKNKKSQRAMAIINTAQGAIAAYQAMAIIPVIGPALGAAAAAMVIQMGKQQVDAINATTYDGGGSVGASSVSVGQRGGAVDLARPSNQAGELQYARGESGVGNIQNFESRFAGGSVGYKNRASGGSTGFIVGEQGPELFMPSVEGNIVPAGEVPSNQAPTNVNFSINMVDATGVEDLLINQRGNIIGMIREAANEHGEMFLESVQEKSY